MVRNKWSIIKGRFGLFTLLLLCLLLVKPVYAADIVDSGTQGTVKWELDADNVLSISATEEVGEMKEFAEDDFSTAWKAYKDQIQEVVIAEGVKNISKNAFKGITNLTEVTIPKSVDYVHVSSFLETKYLNDMIAAQKQGQVKDDDVLLYYSEETKPLNYTVTFASVRVVADEIFADCDITPVKRLWVSEDVEAIGYLGIVPETVYYNGYKKDWDNVKKSERDDFSSAQLTVGKIDVPVLTKVENTDEGVVIEWKPVYGAEVYKVYRKKNSNSSVLIKTIKDTSVLTYTDTKAENAVYEYHVVVEGYGKHGASKSEKVVRMTSTSVSMTNDYDGIKVSWEPVTPSTGYYIDRKEASGEWKQIKKVSGGTEKAYVDKTVKAGKTYSYRISPFYSGTTGPNSEPATIIRLEHPTGVDFENVSNGVKVKWKKVTGATGYYIFKQVGKGSWKKLTTIKKGATVSYIDKNVVSGKTYNYRIQAYAGESVSYKANYGKATYLDGIYRVGVPVITVTNNASGVSIKWKKVSYAEGYYVERRVPNGSWIKIKQIKNVNTVSYLDKDVKNGKKYEYRVRTLHFTYSTVKTIRYLNRPTASVKKSGTKLVVSWNKNGSAKGYEVQHAQNSSFSKNKKTKTIAKNSTVKTNLTGLTKGKTYYVRVRSYCLINGKKVYSPWSKYKSISFK